MIEPIYQTCYFENLNSNIKIYILYEDEEEYKSL